MMCTQDPWEISPRYHVAVMHSLHIGDGGEHKIARVVANPLHNHTSTPRCASTIFTTSALVKVSCSVASCALIWPPEMRIVKYNSTMDAIEASLEALLILQRHVAH
jgi:hypothetical protein